MNNKDTSRSCGSPKPKKRSVRLKSQKSKKKHKYRIRNWSDYKIVFYNTALVQRGSLYLWLDKTTLQNWRCQERTKKRGKPKVYSGQAKSTAAKRLSVLCSSARSTICLCGRQKGCWLLLWLWQEPMYPCQATVRSAADAKR